MIDSLLDVRGCAGWKVWVLFGSMLSENNRDWLSAKLCVVEVMQCAPSVNDCVTQTAASIHNDDSRGRLSIFCEVWTDSVSLYP